MRLLQPFILILMLFEGATADAAPPAKKDIDSVLAEMGIAATRKIDSDVCYPATSEEYEALGKNAVLMLTSSSAMSGELPLKSVYVLSKGVRIPLQRIALFDKRQTEFQTSKGTETYTEQVSFYLLPIQLAKRETRLVADFAGERSDFGIMAFQKNGGSVAGAPTFVRLDEYDNPSEADPEAIAKLLAREYPDFFQTN